MPAGTRVSGRRRRSSVSNSLESSITRGMFDRVAVQQKNLRNTRRSPERDGSVGFLHGDGVVDPIADKTNRSVRLLKFLDDRCFAFGQHVEELSIHPQLISE